MTDRRRRALGGLSFAAGVLAIISLTAPRGCEFRDREVVPDDWYSSQPAETSGQESNWPGLPESDIRLVAAPHLSEAIARLKAVVAVELTPADAVALTGGAIRPRAGTVPVLIRAVWYDRATGRFTVRRLGDALAVQYGCLGRRTPPMAKQPLVVNLPRVPRTVTLALWIAE